MTEAWREAWNRREAELENARAERLRVVDEGLRELLRHDVSVLTPEELAGLSAALRTVTDLRRT